MGLVNWRTTLFILVPAFFIHHILLVKAAEYNVVNYGAVGDGTTDDTKAFSDAWYVMCTQDKEPSVLQIPAGKTFLVDQIQLEGPCSSYIRVEVNGNIKRPNQVWQYQYNDHWILFINVNGISIVGSGEIDGQGAIWWDCKLKNNCPLIAPNMLVFLHCSKVQVWGLKLVNSPMMHMVVGFSVGVEISGVKITSPVDSPNTDGIHIENSRHVIVTDSIVGTGDDCVSISNGAYDVNVSRITCGPGHGISIGSLGVQNSWATAEKINVHDCNIFNTLTGVRIKTWQGGSGFARAITFANINITAAWWPILIDQYYCNGRSGCTIQFMILFPNWWRKTSAVEVSDVSYYGLSGTSTSDMAITLNCSQSAPCKNIKMEKVNFQPANQERKVETYCINAIGSQKDEVYPKISCLTR